jgi:flagellar biosynthetic protein FlhB
MSETEQNKTEEATPFKLKRAREKGQVARSADLGFFAMLTAFISFFVVAGPDAADELSQIMARTLATAVNGSADASSLLAGGRSAFSQAFKIVATCAATLAAVVIFLEVLQLRGLVFSMQPLKPDFNRLNPAKTLKRIFSTRMLKELGKTFLKFLVYGAIVTIVVRLALLQHVETIQDSDSLTNALASTTFQLLAMCLGASLGFAILDQILSRQEFSKQMRMSRSELTREVRDREGEPRLKQRRKKLHAEFAKQIKQLGELQGADMLIVNPTHYAVALAYVPSKMAAPTVKAKGRNHFALLLRRRAALLSIPIVEDRSLARALYGDSATDDLIHPQHYEAVAAHYQRQQIASDARGGSRHVQ